MKKIKEILPYVIILPMAIVLILMSNTFPTKKVGTFWDAAVYLRNMLGSYEALKKFNDVGLNIGPQISDIMLDTYRDNDRNKYVQHAHFEVKFYKKDSTIINGAIFDNINIKTKNIGG